MSLDPLNITEIHFQYGANFQNLASYNKPISKVLFDSASVHYERFLRLVSRKKIQSILKKRRKKFQKFV